MYKLLTISLILFLSMQISIGQTIPQEVKFDDAALVLNVGTFHMGKTSDANKFEFDNRSDENKRKVHHIAKIIADFKPTIMVVESQPKHQHRLDSLYQKYLSNPSMQFDYASDIELLAYEVGRLSNTKKIVGIYYNQEYNYQIGQSLEQAVDPMIGPRYDKMMQEEIVKYFSSFGRPLDLLDTLIGINQPLFLNYLINVNADMLTYQSTKGKAEGADEAATFYHRNLLMFSNLNQIKLGQEDRVFILMGATHTAF